MTATHRAAQILFSIIILFAGLTAMGMAALAIPVAQGALRAPLPSSDGRVTPITDPTALPRLTFEQLQYRGAFRLPADDSNGDSFSLTPGPIAFNPNAGSLFVGARSGRIAEVSIPEPVINGDITALPFARYVQGFADPAEGHLKEIASDGVNLSGLLVYGNRLYGSGLIYYDANNTQALSHFSRPMKLSDSGASAMRRVGQKGRTGFVAGYMAPIPAEWQTKLGGPAITGQCCVPIVSRTSWGPSAFAWNPDDLTRGDASATPLLYYDSDHPTLGAWEGSNPTYGGTIQMGGVALIDGTSTALFVGRNGTGTFCYGEGTADQSLVGKRTGDGERYCFDPAYTSKAQHAYPYRYQMWAYDLNDWAAVRAGKKDPWEVKPYGVWPFDLPFPEPNTRVAGVAFDRATRRLFVAQMEADKDGFSYRPLIHVFQVP